MNKGAQTKALILDRGLELATEIGLSGISIGVIAKACGLSRSGITGHFKDKEDMQISILQHAEDLFISEVLKRSYTLDCAQNLENLKQNWLNWIVPLSSKMATGCPFIKAAVEYQNKQDCEIKRFMSQQQQKLLHYLSDLAQRCLEQRFFSQSVDCQLFAYEFYSIYLGHNVLSILGDSEQDDRCYFHSIDQLIKRSRA